MEAVLARKALDLLDEGKDLAWASIVDTSGSSPRHGGASMLVWAEGQIAGTVGGGALEARVIHQALEVLARRRPSVLDYQLTPEDSAGLGMICGGSGRVVIDFLPASSPEARALVARLTALLSEGSKGWLVTEVEGAADTGWTVSRELSEAEPKQAEAGRPADSERSRYIEPVGSVSTAYVFGAGHCGEKLVPVLGIAGFATVIVDDRPEFADRKRFPTADGIAVLDSFSEGLHRFCIDEDSYIVIVTRGHVHDQTVLAWALQTSAGYIGMIGSRRKVATIFAALEEQGFSSGALARVHAPIGLSIGAETPGEIAVSIAAELVHVRSQAGQRRSQA